MNMKNKIIEKIVNLLLNILIVFFGIILLISLYITVQTKVLHNDYANFFGYSIFEVQTGSMADTINIGDWIIVGLDKNIKINDIVTYKLNKDYITHRVVEAYKDTYVTMGDANNAKDEKITEDQIIGKVVKILPKFGIFRKTIFNPIILITIIITLLLCSIAFDKKKDSIIYKYINKWIQKIKKIVQERKENDLKIEMLGSDKPRISNNVKEIFNIKEEQKKEKEEDKIVNDEVEDIIIDDSKEAKVSELEEKKYDLSEIEDEYVSDDCEKTIFYRNIEVDASDLDEDSIESITKDVVTEAPIPKEEANIELEVEDDSLTNIDLNLLEESKSNKKGKNIIDRVMIIKEEEIDEILNVIDDSQLLVNEPSIKTVFTNAYVDIRYYNEYDDSEGSRKLFNKVESIMKIISKKLIETYKGSDSKYSEKVKRYASKFVLIADLEEFNNIDSVAEVRESFKKSLSEYVKRENKDWNDEEIDSIIQKIIKIKRNYVGIVEYFLNKFDTNVFKLECNNLSLKKNIFVAKLKHNIAFSKVYSDYIIDKTYTEGIIAEDKMSILLTLLSLELVNDMITSNFNKKYMFYVPNTLYKKQKKFEKTLKAIDDEYAKNNILILLTYEELKSNKKFINKIKSSGYKFALTFTKENILKDEEMSDLLIADYIFIDKKKMNVSNMFSYFPEGLSEKLVYEDVLSKIDDYGSE